MKHAILQKDEIYDTGNSQLDDLLSVKLNTSGLQYL